VGHVTCNGDNDCTQNCS